MSKFACHFRLPPSGTSRAVKKLHLNSPRGVKSEIFQPANLSEDLQNISEYFRIFRNLSGPFRRSLEYFRIFCSLSKSSRRSSEYFRIFCSLSESFRRSSKYFRIFQSLSKSFRRSSEDFRIFQSLSESFRRSSEDFRKTLKDFEIVQKNFLSHGVWGLTRKNFCKSFRGFL